jgi:hypothetical protein
MADLAEGRLLQRKFNDRASILGEVRFGKIASSGA